MRTRIIAAIIGKASECQPACIVIDGADHLFARRSSSQSEGVKSIGCCLRATMSRVMRDKDMKVIFIVAATAPQDFDEAFLRMFVFRVYVRLPDRGAILSLLKEYLGKYELDSDITPQKLHDLATTLATERMLSAVDVRNALVHELRFFLKGDWFLATHFKEVREDERLLSLLNNGHHQADTMEQETLGGQQILLPCSPSQPGAFQCRYTDMSGEQLARVKLKKVKMADVERIMRQTADLTRESTIDRFNKFNNEFGTRVD